MCEFKLGNQVVVCHIISTMDCDVLPIDSSEDTFSQLMSLGTTNHVAGDCVKALMAFESAVALNPQNTNAVSSCAALLFELDRPRAAFDLLQSIDSQLLLDADGCANLGVAALSCGQVKAAVSYFQQALKLSPTHTAALTHLGLLSAREQRWFDAIDYARQCVACLPNDETVYTNLIDYLLGARRTSEALQQWQAIPEHFKNHPQIAIRQVVALALNAEFDAANLAMNQLNPQTQNELTLFLQRGGAADLRNLFYRQALDAMLVCDWRDYPHMCAVLGEENLHQGFQASHTVDLTEKSKTPPPFSASARTTKPSDCIRIGVAAGSLRDAAATDALAAELSLYDSARFQFLVYSPTPKPQAVLSAPLAAFQVVEMAHFTDEEAVWRIRLDRLDIWFDLTCNTPWHRPFITQHRVAPLQVLPWQGAQQFATTTYDYVLSDIHLSGTSGSGSSHIALARLPHTCWHAPFAIASLEVTVSRTVAGLPVDAFVICVFGPSAHINPKTFALWMQLLHQLPHAILWLSPCSPNAQTNLWQEAMQTGVPANRLIFAPVDANIEVLLPLADLYLNASANSNHQTLTQVLRAGLPAMATGSRMATSVLHAAGLHDCFFENPEDYFAKALYLAQNPAALKALRERMQASVEQSPLFDMACRVSEKAAAWTQMVQRSRAGLVPETFDVQQADITS